MATTISVVTPSYNQVKYVEQTLRSVIGQRADVHEYFVMDGGSTDGSVDVIRRYADRIDYWISEKDRGQSDAIHKGFSRATGDVLCWLNSDDLFLPGALRTVREAFDRHPEWDVVLGYHVNIDAEGRLTAVHRIPGQTLSWLKWGILHVAQQACFFRRSLYERVGGLDLSLHCVMDSELWIRFLAAGAKWGHVREHLAAYRLHEETKTAEWHKGKYASEDRKLDEKYPAFRLRGIKGWLGKSAYRATQVLSGRYPRARLETWRLRGKRLEEVYGDAGSEAA